MKYRIHWKARKTGATGHGEPIFDSFYQAQQTADDLNRKDHEKLVFHWIEAVQENQTENPRAG